MDLQNIKEVAINVYGDSRSDIPTFRLEEPIEGFSYGDAFGSDGKEIWLDVNQDLSDFNEEDDGLTSEHEELHELLREWIRDNLDF